jgi:predicted amidohydrolase YtcJ
MTRWGFDGIGLPDGEQVHFEVGSGDPEVLPGRFALPGLVDSHCHLTVGMVLRGRCSTNSGRPAFA